jgi:uncharacterized protein
VHAELIRVTLIYSPASGSVVQQSLQISLGQTTAEALQAAGYKLADGEAVAVFSKIKTLADTLQNGDRLEVCRPLLCDPKEARRLRYKQKPKKPKPNH